MNKIQRNIIMVGLVLVILNGVFLPYKSVCAFRYFKGYKRMGYYFILTPPTRSDAYEVFVGKKPDKSPSPRFSSHIMTFAPWFQLVTIIVVVIGLLSLFSEKRNNGITKMPKSNNNH